jgi:uncharacterized membrane protein HdeD (DUF308 family)
MPFTLKTTESKWQRVRGALTLAIGTAAVAAPLATGAAISDLAGLAAIATGAMEGIVAFQRGRLQLTRVSSYAGALAFILSGALLLMAPVLALSALVMLIAVSFGLNGITKIAAGTWRNVDRSMQARAVDVAWGTANVLIALLLLANGRSWGLLAVSVFVGANIFATGWALLFGPTLKDESATPGTGAIDLEAHPDEGMSGVRGRTVAALRRAHRIAMPHMIRRDRVWTLTVLIALLGIHAARTSAELTFVGLAGPFVAVLGDVIVSVMVGLLLAVPITIGWRALSRPVERALWSRYDRGAGNTPPLLRWILARRIARSEELVRIGQDIRFALWRGLQKGLPVVLILVATNPIWGFSWYFNSENWAADIWHRWADRRTDDWRVAMVRAVAGITSNAETVDLPDGFAALKPVGVNDVDPFTFLIVGDPGEGDASQLILSNQYATLSQREDVRFMVISSDVIYPDGAMKDYERCFYLPFRGFTKPIYAIPGNHDWYDALEGFNANFLDATSAVTAMRARRDHDLRLTSTTEARIANDVKQAEALRRAYNIQTGLQRGPFFEVQTDRFALICIDTGVARSLDRDQLRWFEQALDRAKDKFTLVVTGHPLYAGGANTSGGDEAFESMFEVMRRHRVDVVMAGDTHYFEYYREVSPGHTLHHFVNGGGGAYLSIGSGLNRPKPEPVPDVAYFPRTDALVAKLDAETPLWKRPIWLWTRRMGGWPFTTETMSGAFDFNGVPSFQSFVEVTVDPTRNTVQIIPRGVDGPLRWRDMDIKGDVRPADSRTDDVARFVYPLPAAP